MSKHDDAYEAELKRLQLALVHTQMHAIKHGDRFVILLEGRDGAGKDGVISRIIEHLAPRYTRVVSLPKPSDRERTEWWFQRYVRRLPAAGEFVIFNRSWYNRAGVEPVMGFCTPTEHDQFLRDAPAFEAMLVESGVKLVKYWLDISRHEQAHRLDDRRHDPLKALKVSDMDAEAQSRWEDYGRARNQMLSTTHTAIAPWTCIHTDDKKAARLNLLRHFLRAVGPASVTQDVAAPEPDIAFSFDQAALTDGRLEP